MLVSKELYHEYQMHYAFKSEKVRFMELTDDFFNPSPDVVLGNRLVSTAGTRGSKGEFLETTGSDLIDEYTQFVLGLQHQTDSLWFSIRDASSEITSDVNRVLSLRAEHLYRLILKTNYYASLTELEKHIVLHGHGLLNVYPSEERGVLADFSVEAPTPVVLRESKTHKLYYSAWVESVSYFDLVHRFDSFKLNRNLTEADKNATFSLLSVYVEAKEPYVSFSDLEELSIRLGFKPKFVQVYTAWTGASAGLIKKIDRLKFFDIEEREYFRERTAFPTRDLLLSDTSYGKGVGHKALPKSRILNRMMYLFLKTAGLQANPPMVIDEDLKAEMGQKELHEGQVFVGSSTSLGKPVKDLVHLLNVTGDLNSLFQIYQAQQAQLANLLPTAGSIYKIARQSITEIQQRLEEQEKRLSPLRVNFLREGPEKHLRYLYSLANRKGEFNKEHLKLPDGVKVDSFDFLVDANLLSHFKQGKAVRLARALGAAANFLNLKPAAVDKLNGDKIIETIFDGFKVLGELHSRENTNAIRKKREEELRRQQQEQQLQGVFEAAGNQASLLGSLKNLEGTDG